MTESDDRGLVSGDAEQTLDVARAAERELRDEAINEEIEQTDRLAETLSNRPASDSDH